MQVKEVWLVSDNTELVSAAQSFEWPEAVSLTVIAISELSHLRRNIDKTVALIVDATKLDATNRSQIEKAGNACQRIVIGDDKFDNRLGKIHLPANAIIEDIASGLDSVERFVNPNYEPSAPVKAKPDDTPTPTEENEVSFEINTPLNTTTALPRTTTLRRVSRPSNDKKKICA